MLEICIYACKRKRVKGFGEIRLPCKSISFGHIFTVAIYIPVPRLKWDGNLLCYFKVLLHVLPPLLEPSLLFDADPFTLFQDQKFLQDT